jgi:3-oxoacyl-[acyl-carrier protein] reductase
MLTRKEKAMTEAKRIVVTGGASGIGLEVVKLMSANAAKVFIIDVNPQLEAKISEIRNDESEISGRVTDLADPDDAVEGARAALTALGGCDVLVNCAGITAKKDGNAIPLTELDLDTWDRTLRINLTSPFLMCRELLPSMVAGGYGRIVNISSRSGRSYVSVAGSEYHASKAGLLGLTRAIAGAYGRHGITANCVAPGRIETPLTKLTDPELLHDTLRGIPAGRFGKASEIAQIVTFLASEGAAYVNGACVDAHGGIYMS